MKKCISLFITVLAVLVALDRFRKPRDKDSDDFEC